MELRHSVPPKAYGERSMDHSSSGSAGSMTGLGFLIYGSFLKFLYSLGPCSFLIINELQFLIKKMPISIYNSDDRCTFMDPTHLYIYYVQRKKAIPLIELWDSIYKCCRMHFYIILLVCWVIILKILKVLIFGVMQSN